MSSPPSPVPAAHGNCAEDAENACAIEAAACPAVLEAPEVAHGANNEEDDDNAPTGSSGSLINFGDRPKSKVRSLSIPVIMASCKLYPGPMVFRRNSQTHCDSHSNICARDICSHLLSLPRLRQLVIPVINKECSVAAEKIDDYILLGRARRIPEGLHLCRRWAPCLCHRQRRCRPRPSHNHLSKSQGGRWDRCLGWSLSRGRRWGDSRLLEDARV